MQRIDAGVINLVSRLVGLGLVPWGLNTAFRVDACTASRFKRTGNLLSARFPT